MACSYEVSPLAPSFGCLVTAKESSNGLPDPVKIMELFENSGALLLRGFPFTKESFVAFGDRCCAGFSNYVGGGARFRSLDRIARGGGGTLMTTTGDAQAFSMPLHGEMYYQGARPDMLWFFCERPPQLKGQTTLADGCAIFAGLSDRAKALLRSSRLKYVRDLAAEDWPVTFQTEDRAELRRICHENGMTLEERPDGSVGTEYLVPAIVTGSSGEEVFINSAVLIAKGEQGMRAGSVIGAVPERIPLVVRLEDGSEIPNWLIEDIEAVSEPLIVEVAWQRGDAVMVDNSRILHGRRKTKGDREILVRLGNLERGVAA